MKWIHKILFLPAAVYFSSCSNHPAIPTTTDSLRSLNSLAGKIYFFAPAFDSTNLVAMGDCDCCAANTLFLNDSSFLEIEFCDEGSTYILGKYRADDRSISLFYDSVNVNEYLQDTEDTGYSKSGKTVYHVSIGQQPSITYQKQQYKGVNLFLNKLVGAPDKERKYNEVLKEIQDEGIWDRLHTNPATIPRNSFLIENSLQGCWSRPVDTAAYLKIMDDSLYWFGRNQKYLYTINHDSLRIVSDHNVIIYPVKMRGNDTLIFEGPERQVFYRSAYYK